MSMYLILFFSVSVFSQIPEKAFNLSVLEKGFEFTPAPEHHFNDKAPNKVEISVNGKAQKAGGFVFAKDKIKTEKPAANSKSCEVTAQLYVCDEKETYCVPRKHKYKCSGEPLSEGSSLKGKTSFNKPVKKGLFYINSEEAAFLEAKKKDKLLLIDFYGIWCPPCNMLDETVFSSKRFQSFSKKYVFLKMDADTDLSWNLKSRYKVTGYPTVILAKSNGEEILRIVGSRKPEAFYKDMQNAFLWKDLSQSEISKLNNPVEITEVKALEKALDGKNNSQIIEWANKIILKPELLVEVEWTIADIYSVLGAAYEEKGEVEQAKLNYKNAFDEYTKLIKNAGLNVNTTRGYNLERIYCLWKSGDYINAKKYYENLEKIYPQEFTFYYQHAHMLKEQKMFLLSLEKAQLAFKYSYGDNKLRAAGLVAELQMELGQKAEALKTLNEAIHNFDLPQDKTIRTHRYFDKLVKLKEKLV